MQNTLAASGQWTGKNAGKRKCRRRSRGCVVELQLKDAVVLERV
jgi:hypothetical protein